MDFSWNIKGLEASYKAKDYYDVIFCGTSMAITNVSNEELYLKYGVASVTLAKPEQAAFLSYYSLKEALEYQSPKVVFFDVRSLFYTDEENSNKFSGYEQYHLHYTLDEMKNNKTKYEAVLQAKEFLPDLDILEYFLPLYYNHSNWEEFSENYVKDNKNDHILSGNLTLYGCLSNVQNVDAISRQRESNDGSSAYIENTNQKYLIKMWELCQEKGVQLILINSREINPWIWEEYNGVQSIAKLYDIPYLDINLYDEEVGFDWTYDSDDGKHHNIVGAKKWTDFLGNYLIENFEFEDRRKDPAYAAYEQEKDRYYSLLSGMEDKIALLKGIDFDSYLEKLAGIDQEENVILFCMNDDGTMSLTDKEYRLLNKLGLNESLRDKFRYSYVAVMGGTDRREQLGEGAVSVTGSIDEKIVYEVTSGGLLSGVPASIKLDGVEKIQGGRGINIVVYNKAIGDVISSVFFDTYETENPPTARMTDIRQKQIEITENEWVIPESE